MSISLCKFSDEMSKLKGIPKEVASFLTEENFSSEEIILLTYFFENKFLYSKNNLLKNKASKKALDELIQKCIIEKKSNNFQLISIEHFFSWIRNNTKNKVKKLEVGTQSFIDVLRSTLTNAVQSDVVFYEGIEGIKDSYRHILDNAKNEISAYYSVVETIQPELQQFFENEYTSERAKRNIFSRNITSKTPKTIYFSLKKESLNMDIKMVSKEVFPLLNAEINIYGEFMHCMTFDENGGFAVIIKGDIVKLQQALFDIAWKGISSFPVEKQGDQSNLFLENLYHTDDSDFLLEKINNRKDKFFSGMKEQWGAESPVLEKTKKGETILRIFDLEVMSDFEKPYMKALASNVTMHGGNILNIGFGLGIVDTYIEKNREIRNIKEHHIIELNDGVFKMAEEWKKKQKNKDKIHLHKGNWEDILPQLKKDGYIFDGVIYDAYPLEIDEICRDSVSFLYSLIQFQLVKEQTGVITFYMDSIEGMGSDFQKSLYQLGVGSVQTQKIYIELPDRDCEYWDTDFFLAPLLTNIAYTN